MARWKGHGFWFDGVCVWRGAVWSSCSRRPPPALRLPALLQPALACFAPCAHAWQSLRSCAGASPALPVRGLVSAWLRQGHPHPEHWIWPANSVAGGAGRLRADCPGVRDFEASFISSSDSVPSRAVRARDRLTLPVLQTDFPIGCRHHCGNDARTRPLASHHF